MTVDDVRTWVVINPVYTQHLDSHGTSTCSLNFWHGSVTPIINTLTIACRNGGQRTRAPLTTYLHMRVRFVAKAKATRSINDGAQCRSSALPRHFDTT